MLLVNDFSSGKEIPIFRFSLLNNARLHTIALPLSGVRVVHSARLKQEVGAAIFH
jgi:hypothetical protein